MVFPHTTRDGAARDNRADSLSGRLAIDTPQPGVRVIGTRGVFDSGSGARFLRLVDAQLDLTRAGHRRIDRIVADLSGATAFSRGGPEALVHAHESCARRGVEFVLAGLSGRLSSAPLRVGGRLAAVESFPTVDSAVSAPLRHEGHPAPERAARVPG